MISGHSEAVLNDSSSAEKAHSERQNFQLTKTAAGGINDYAVRRVRIQDSKNLTLRSNRSKQISDLRAFFKSLEITEYTMVTHH